DPTMLPIGQKSTKTAVKHTSWVNIVSSSSLLLKGHPQRLRYSACLSDTTQPRPGLLMSVDILFPCKGSHRLLGDTGAPWKRRLLHVSHVVHLQVESTGAPICLNHR